MAKKYSLPKNDTPMGMGEMTSTPKRLEIEAAEGGFIVHKYGGKLGYERKRMVLKSLEGEEMETCLSWLKSGDKKED